MNNALKISIVVIVYNGEQTLHPCLESITAQRIDTMAQEVLVVDNGSTDSTPDIIRSFPVKYIYEARRNRACARNTGVRNATGDIIAFIDADCVAKQDWLSCLMAKFNEDAHTGAVAGALLSEPNSPVERYIDFRRIVDQEKMLESGRCCSPPFALTANLAIRKKVFDEVGLFDDEHLPVTGEDADFCWRMQWAGFTIGYAPDAIVWHKHRSSLSLLFTQTYGYGFSNVSLFAKHHERFNRRYWIDTRYYVWLMKAFFKLPYSLIVEKDEFKRRIPLYDFVANLGIITGKIRGSLYHRKLVL